MLVSIKSCNYNHISHIISCYILPKHCEEKEPKYEQLCIAVHTINNICDTDPLRKFKYWNIVKQALPYITMEGCSRAISLAMSTHCAWGHLLVCLSCSLLHIAATLWSRHSNRKSYHSWWWVVLQPGWSLLSSSRYRWPQRAHSVTLFECSVLRASCFAYLPKAAKLLYCSITDSSILQWSVMHVVTVLL